MDPAPVRWSARRHPGRAFLAWTICLALLLGLGTAWLVPRLMIDPAPWIGPLAGLALAAALVASIVHGSHSFVTADGLLVYGLRGQDCVQVDLRRVEAVRPVRAGLLGGAGIACPPEALTYLSRKGPNRRQAAAMHRALGTPLVLEFHTPEDAAALEALRRDLALAPATA